MGSIMRLWIIGVQSILFLVLSVGVAFSGELTPPKNVKASEGKHKDIVRIEWTKLDNVDSYRVYRSADFDGSFSVISEETSGVSFDDLGAESAVYYWYRVSSLKDGDESSQSPSVQGWKRPFMAAIDKSKTDMIFRLAKLYPHIKNVKSLAIERQSHLPVPAKDYEQYVPSSEKIFGYVEQICSVPHRRIGSPESRIAEKLIVEKLKSFLDKEAGAGKTNVFMEPVAVDVYNAQKSGLKLENPDGTINDYDAFYTVNTGITYKKPHGGTVKGKMIWGGMGTKEDFEKLGNDLSGKIVVAQCLFPSVPAGMLDFFFSYYTSDPKDSMNLLTKLSMTFKRENLPPEYTEERNEDSVYWLAHDRGAEGLVLIMKDHPGKTNTHWGPYDGKMRSMPTMYVSNYKDEEMTNIAKSGANATMTIEGSLTKGFGHNIYGILPGNGKSREKILISSHHDSPFLGATEDGTGTAMVLAMAETWSQVEQEKRDKDIIFVLSTGHHYAGIGAKTFAEKHSEGLLKNLAVNINLEHLAAKHYVDDGKGNMVWNGEQALTLVFVNEDTTAISVARRMLQTLQPEKTLLVPSNLLGPVPPGESGHYHIHTGVDFIHWISSPYYLLTNEDTLEKIDQSLLNPIALAVSEMIATYMILPSEK
ncbi:M28 family peptidase [bacterium]|nr:M28 family peptidase [bacterium]